MSKVKFHPIIEEVKGKNRNLVFKQYKGKPYTATRPDMSNRKLSPKQSALVNSLGLASKYASFAMKNPEVRALYAVKADAKSRPVVSVAIADYMNAPVISGIDTTGYHRKTGDTILVDATDDFEVMSVGLTIADIAGVIVESGFAENTEAYPNIWTYTATTTLPDASPLTIVATAMDRPKNKTVEKVAV